MPTTRPILLLGLVITVVAAGVHLRAEDEDAHMPSADSPTRLPQATDAEGRLIPMVDEQPLVPQQTALRAQAIVLPEQPSANGSLRLVSDDAPPATPENIDRPQRTACQASECQNSGNCKGSRWQDEIKPRLQYRYWGYAPYFQEPGLGASVYPMINAQIGRGLAEQLVLYDYDFTDNGNGARLNAHGMRQVCRMAGVIAHSDLTLVIERSDGRPALDEARRRAVLQASLQLPVPLPENRVAVSCTSAAGLRGAEAEIIDFNQLRQTSRGMQERTYSSAAAFSGSVNSGAGGGSQ